MTTNTQVTTTLDPMAAIRARAAELASKPKARTAKQPRECACGCKGMTRGGIWLPGHDAKALSAMLREMRTTKSEPDGTASEPCAQDGMGTDANQGGVDANQMEQAQAA